MHITAVTNTSYSKPVRYVAYGAIALGIFLLIGYTWKRYHRRPSPNNSKKSPPPKKNPPSQKLPPKDEKPSLKKPNNATLLPSQRQHYKDVVSQFHQRFGGSEKVNDDSLVSQTHSQKQKSGEVSEFEDDYFAFHDSLAPQTPSKEPDSSEFVIHSNFPPAYGDNKTDLDTPYVPRHQDSPYVPHHQNSPYVSPKRPRVRAILSELKEPPQRSNGQQLPPPLQAEIDHEASSRALNQDEQERLLALNKNYLAQVVKTGISPYVLSRLTCGTAKVYSDAGKRHKAKSVSQGDKDFIAGVKTALKKALSRHPLPKADKDFFDERPPDFFLGHKKSLMIEEKDPDLKGNELVTKVANRIQKTHTLFKQISLKGLRTRVISLLKEDIKQYELTQDEITELEKLPLVYFASRQKEFLEDPTKQNNALQKNLISLRMSRHIKSYIVKNHVIFKKAKDRQFAKKLETALLSASKNLNLTEAEIRHLKTLPTEWTIEERNQIRQQNPTKKLSEAELIRKIVALIETTDQAIEAATNRQFAKCIRSQLLDQAQHFKPSKNKQNIFSRLSLPRIIEKKNAIRADDKNLSPDQVEQQIVDHFLEQVLADERKIFLQKVRSRLDDDLEITDRELIEIRRFLFKSDISEDLDELLISNVSEAPIIKKELIDSLSDKSLNSTEKKYLVDYPLLIIIKAKTEADSSGWDDKMASTIDQLNKSDRNLSDISKKPSVSDTSLITTVFSKFIGGVFFLVDAISPQRSEPKTPKYPIEGIDIPISKPPTAEIDTPKSHRSRKRERSKSFDGTPSPTMYDKQAVETEKKGSTCDDTPARFDTPGVGDDVRTPLSTMRQRLVSPDQEPDEEIWD